MEWLKEIEWSALSTWLILGPLIWLIMSIKIIGPAQMAVLVIFGKPVVFRDSGFQFVPWFFGCYLVIYPKKIYSLDYKATEALTRREDGDSSDERQVVKVDSTLYLNFPREREKKNGSHPLVKILRAQVPISDDKLREWTEEAVFDAIRTVLGGMTWQHAVEHKQEVSNSAQELLSQSENPLSKAGFGSPGIKLAITEIRLPGELEEAFAKKGRVKVEAEAAGFVAQRRATETAGAFNLAVKELGDKDAALKLVARDMSLKTPKDSAAVHIITGDIQSGEGDGKGLKDQILEVVGAAGILWNQTQDKQGGKPTEQKPSAGPTDTSFSKKKTKKKDSSFHPGYAAIGIASIYWVIRLFFGWIR